MDNKLSIKVTLAGRTYPLTIDREEEEVIRLAAKNINESIQHFQDNYAVKDKQDLLAMTALDLATQVAKKTPEVDETKYSEGLALVQQKLSNYLKQ